MPYHRPEHQSAFRRVLNRVPVLWLLLAGFSVPVALMFIVGALFPSPDEQRAACHKSCAPRQAKFVPAYPKSMAAGGKPVPMVCECF